MDDFLCPRTSCAGVLWMRRRVPEDQWGLNQFWSIQTFLKLLLLWPCGHKGAKYWPSFWELRLACAGCLRDSGGECFAPCEARSPQNSHRVPWTPTVASWALRASFDYGSSFGRLRVRRLGCSRWFPWPGLVPKPSWEVQLMALEPGFQTRPLEQTEKSKKDAKMTPQTTDNREAPPRASELRGSVLRTM